METIRATRETVKRKITAARALKQKKFKEMSRLINFSFIDIRAIFIVISVYSTVVTLISSTATNEATRDANSGKLFNITSRPEHQNKLVVQISDAVLWNCREKSVTHHYYRGLYGLLFGCFGLVVLIFLVTRVTVLYGWRYRLGNRLSELLWQMAIVQRLKKIVKQYGPEDEFTDRKAASYEQQWHGAEQRMTRNTPWLIAMIPYLEAVCLVVNLPFIITSYTLHPLSCVVGPNDNFITYNNASQSVELQFSSALRIYQKAAIGIALFLIAPLILLAITLYCKYKSVIRSITKDIDRPKPVSPDQGLLMETICDSSVEKAEKKLVGKSTQV